MKPAKFDRLKQPLSSELKDACLEVIRSKFYQGDDKGFYQERQHLLREVILWPASWLNNRGVTLHGDHYRQIFIRVFIEAAAHVQSKVRYRPAYLKQVIQSHFKKHGEEYYDQAKSTRNLIEQTIVDIGHAGPRQADPVRELATARQILATRHKKATIKTSLNNQLTLFK
jgi:hypothetical protein